MTPDLHAFAGANVWFEEVTGSFYKAHLDGVPPKVKLHYLTNADPGLPHDHPLDFHTLIIFGGYTEHRYADDGSYEVIQRNPGDKFFINARTIHLITDMHGGPTVTASVYGPVCNTWAHFDWRDGQIWHQSHIDRIWREGRG